MIDLTDGYQSAFLLLEGLTLISVLAVIFFHHPDKEWIPGLKNKQKIDFSLRSVSNVCSCTPFPP